MQWSRPNEDFLSFVWRKPIECKVSQIKVIVVLGKSTSHSDLLTKKASAMLVILPHSHSEQTLRQNKRNKKVKKKKNTKKTKKKKRNQLHLYLNEKLKRKQRNVLRQRHLYLHQRKLARNQRKLLRQLHLFFYEKKLARKERTKERNVQEMRKAIRTRERRKKLK